MKHALNTSQPGLRAAVVTTSPRACLRRDSLARRFLCLRKPLLVSSVLCMGMSFAVSASPPTQNDPQTNAEADWEVRRDLHDCAHVAGPPVRTCLAYVMTQRSAKHELSAAPASVYWREETRLRQADIKFAAALNHCAELARPRQAACRAVARQEIVQLWNETRRADLRAAAERSADRVAAVVRAHTSPAHLTERTSTPFHAPQ